MNRSKEIEDMTLDDPKGKKEEQERGKKEVTDMGLDEGLGREEREKLIHDVKDMTLDEPAKDKEEEKKKEEEEKKKAEEERKKKDDEKDFKRPDVLDIKARLEKIVAVDVDEIDLGQDLKMKRHEDGSFTVEGASFDQLETATLLQIEAYLKFKESEKPDESQAKDFEARIEKLFPKESYLYITEKDVLVRRDDKSYSLNAIAIADLTDDRKKTLDDFLKLREKEQK